MTARLTPLQQAAVDGANELMLAAATGPDALAEAVGCTDPSELYVMAFGAAISRMQRQAEVIAELTGGAS